MKSKILDERFSGSIRVQIQEEEALCGSVSAVQNSSTP